MPFFDILEGISPWWWVALAFVLGALEMATMSTFLIWPSLAALLMAVFLGLFTDVSGEMQITLFAVLSVVLMFAGRALIQRYGDGGGKEHETLNHRARHFVGRQAKVLEFSNGEGIVEVEGMRWRAQWSGGTLSSVDQMVVITKTDGMVLHVEPSR